MGEIASAYVSIYPKVGPKFGSDLQSQVGKASASAFGPIDKKAGESGKLAGSKFGDSFRSVAGPMVAVASVGAISEFVKSSVDSFSELEDATAAASVVFGDSMDTIQAQADGAAQAIFMSKKEAIDAAITFGTFGKSAGLSGDALAGFSTKMVQLAGDMASFRGTSPEQAIEAIGAAMRGESEPIRAYGVLLDDATLKARAMKLGLISTTKEGLTPQVKVLAAQAEILAQTTDAQGDAARTANSTANVQKRLRVEVENFNAALGEKLAPTIVEVQEGLSNLMGMTEGNTSAMGPLTDTAHALAAAFNDVSRAMSGGTEAGKILKPFLDAMSNISLVKPLQDLANAYLGWSGSANAATAAAKDSAAAKASDTAATEDNTGATNDNSAAQQTNAEKLQAVYQAQLTLRGDHRALESAIDSGTESLKKYRDGLIKKYEAEGKSKTTAAAMADAAIKAGKALDTNTEAGRTNQAALDGIASAALSSAENLTKLDPSGKKAAAEMDRGRSAFIKTATQMGLAKDEAKKLADKLGLIKSKKVSIEVGLNINPNRRGIVTKTTNAGTVKLGYLADGGGVTGGTPGRDSVPAMLMPGEHVLTTREVQQIGGQSAAYRMRALIRRGALRFADGGAVLPTPAQSAPAASTGAADIAGAIRDVFAAGVRAEFGSMDALSDTVAGRIVLAMERG